jgi:two-component system response regulator AtoC
MVDSEHLVPGNHLLLIGDQRDILQLHTRELKKSSWQISSCSSQSINLTQSSPYSLIVLFSDACCDKTLATVSSLRKTAECSVVLVATPQSTTHDEVLTFINAGADDVLLDWKDTASLLFLYEKVAARYPQRSREAVRHGARDFIAASPSMMAIVETVERLSQFTTTVLITGESGTGKECIAKSLHKNSPRRQMPFVAVNCGAIPETLIESELFGHKRGAFTDASRDKRGLFEEAHGGTLFLDEIGELPLHLQVKLLRALQEQQIRKVGDEVVTPIDVRIIAATHKDLEIAVQEKTFRDDLFFRLNVVSIHIPPLRERPEDIAPLVQLFIKKYSSKLGIQIDGITDAALSLIKSALWRGNVRELENCIERAVVLTETRMITPRDLPHYMREQSAEERHGYAMNINDATPLDLAKHLAETERYIITKALQRTNGNRTHAAKVLNISHRTLLYKIKEYEIR